MNKPRLIKQKDERGTDCYVVIETDEMSNWLHPQTDERKDRIKSIMTTVRERVKMLRWDADPFREPQVVKRNRP